MVTINTAERADLDDIIGFLQANHLPEAGLRETDADLLVARDGSRLIGTAALEVRGEEALLRSVAVDSGRAEPALGRRSRERPSTARANAESGGSSC
jgi:N-acetylglutamate synthase-like GNAT family acetyltransferase